jgi:DNA-directed RNA polymerase specialized sigma24 family protein
VTPLPDAYESEVAELQAIVGRDADAFSRWFARCELALKRSLVSYAPYVDVESVTQDTALRVWQHASSITPDRRAGFLLRWAVTVARNHARNHAKRAGREVPLVVDVTPAPRAAEGTGRLDPLLRERVARCLSRLSRNPRKAIEVRASGGGAQPDRALAAAIGMGFDAFRQNLARGRAALTKCLRKSGIDIAEYLA